MHDHDVILSRISAGLALIFNAFGFISIVEAAQTFSYTAAGIAALSALYFQYKKHKRDERDKNTDEEHTE